MCYTIYPSDDYSCRTAYYQTGFLHYLLHQYLGKIWGEEKFLVPLNHMLKKYYAQSSDQDDLISIGTIGLIKGISSFDPSKGARLATYAARCIENEILMYFRSQKKLQGEVSLSETIESDREGNALQLMDVIGVDDTMLEDLYDRDSALRLRRLVKECLTQRESEVIRLRYGLGGTVPLTQREIASTFGISRSYVSRIEKRALEKLRAELEKPVGSGAGQ